jgi:hypothetical protein
MLEFDVTSSAAGVDLYSSAETTDEGADGRIVVNLLRVLKDSALDRWTNGGEALPLFHRERL